jgi:hypothetical protein
METWHSSSGASGRPKSQASPVFPGFRSAPSSSAHLVARGLGWFSIGLGLAECLMPQTMARIVGLGGKENVLRGFGVREIATGVGILMSRDPEPWIWGRVAGDMLDLGTLTAGLRPENPHRTGTLVAMLAVAQVTAADVACAAALRREREAREGPFIDYSDRGGFSRPALQMRGAALSTFETPAGYRIPEALRPWDAGELPAGGLYV